MIRHEHRLCSIRLRYVELKLANLAIINDAVEEGASGEVLQGGGGGTVMQQVLGGQQDQGLLKGPVQLAPEGVKQLRRGGGIHHKHVGQPLCVAPHVLHHHPLPYFLQQQRLAVQLEVT